MYTDFVIQLKNAAMARKKDITTPYSNMSRAIAKVLVKEGFLESAKEETIEGKKRFSVKLRYQSRKPAITDVLLLSKPSLRKYVTAGEIGKIQGKAAVAVISTSAGVLSGKEAVRKGVGGELLFKIW